MTQETISLASIDRMDEAAFVAAFGDIYEHSPWVARAAHASRPFGSVAALHRAMAAAVASASPEARLALLRAHPELATPARLTAASASEQGGMGLDRLDGEEAAAFQADNRAYSARFGFPFVVAVRGQRDRAAIRSALAARLAHDPETEMATALAEVDKIARFRLEDRILEDRILEDRVDERG